MKKLQIQYAKPGLAAYKRDFNPILAKKTPSSHLTKGSFSFLFTIMSELPLVFHHNQAHLLLLLQFVRSE